MNRIILISLLTPFLFFSSCSPPEQRSFSLESKTEASSQLTPSEQFFLQRGALNHSFSTKTYSRALRQAVRQKRQKSRSPGFDEEWIVRGPANVGARVNTIAVRPDNENVVYIGYSTGGLFKTADGGLNWTPLFDDQAFTSIGDIAIDPQNPDVIYAGTGDPNISGYPFIGNGVYRSANGGLNWEHLGLEEQRIVSKIIAHPQNADVLYVACMGLPFEENSERGLYRTTDGGQNWEQILFVDEQAGIIDLYMNPQNPDVLYAVSWDRIRNNRVTIVQGENGRIYKTTDGGDSWAALSEGLPQGATGRIGLAMYEANPEILIALYLDDNDDMAALYRTENGGANWNLIVERGAENGLPTNPLSGMGWYLGRIAINPQDDQDLFLLGVNAWRSRDGGQNWSLATRSSPVHVDNHDIVFDSKNNIYLGTDGGFYRSKDNGANWEDIERIPTTQFYRTAYNPHRPDWYYGGAQDNGTLGGANLEDNWTRFFGADGFQMQFHPENPDIFYVETQRGGISYTGNGGSIWQSGRQGIAGLDRRHWDMPYIISAHRPTILYAGTYRVYKSTKEGAPFWEPISEDLSRGNLWGGSFNTITAINESPQDSNLIYAGTADGRVWRTDDGGQNWREITFGLPDRYVSSIKSSPIEPDRVLLSNTGYKDNDFAPHIHISEDRGENWTSIAENLPPLAVNDVYILPEYNDDLLFAATDGGVYATINRGEAWERLGVNLPVVPVYDLEFNVENNELIAATFGRSIQTYPLEELIRAWSDRVSSALSLNQAAIRIFPNPAANWIHIDGLTPGPASAALFNTKGQLVLSLADLQEGKGRIAVTGLPSGLYYLSISQEGLRRAVSFVKE